MIQSARLRATFLVATAAAVLPMPARATLTEGSRMPAFSLTTTAGNKIDLAKRSGKVVLVDFWATWCPPCKREIPVLQKLHKKYAKQGLRVIGVSIGEGLQAPAKYARAQGLTYEIAYTGDTEAQAIGRAFDFTGIPTTYVVDKRGMIRFAEQGYGPRTPEALDKLIQRLLAEKTR